MIPVMQTEVGDRGNCYSACLASLLHLPISDVPNFFDTAADDSPAAWFAGVREWLAGHNLCVTSFEVDANGRFYGWSPHAYLITCGKSPRGRDHATIWKGGVMVHDPHPDGTGILVPDSVDLLYPLDPFRSRP